MENNLEQRMKKYAKQHKRKKIWQKILSVLSAVVVFCTTYALILPAITQERETFCGFEEHIHSEECSKTEEKLLICELSEEEGHTHSESCFENKQICETEENHVHTEECYENTIICELLEREGHSHGDECYEIKTVSCEKEEHSHSLECYSDKTADIETEEQWNAGFASVQLSETLSENLITIAKSQLGYHESTRNYIVLDDGETIKGRTRYGEWFEEPYYDWNILFVGFCLDYAGADIPFNSDAEKWVEYLSEPGIDIYKNIGERELLPGDIVFFDEDKDEKPERAGIVSEISDSEIKLIIGDYGDSVQSVSFDKADETIFGFAAIAIPSPYKCGLEEHIHDDRCFDDDGNLFCGTESHRHDESCLEEKEQEPVEDAEEYFCGMNEHAHSEDCYDENGNLVCEVPEHAHTEECSVKEEYFCGMNEHAHSEDCYDENGNLVCEVPEHAHIDECKISFENLPEEERLRIENVIAAIESLPSADEIFEKIDEFEETEDYEGEEAWLTQIYNAVGLAYRDYMNLPENHRKFVANSEKLMELEFIWSAAKLIELEIGKTAEYTSDMFTSSDQFIIYTNTAEGYYAINGSGGAVSINIDANGIITANIGNKDDILWAFSGSDGEYRIKNVSSGRYLHAFSNNGGGVTTTGEYSSFIEETSGGVLIRSNTSDYAKFDEDNIVFVPTQNASEAAVYNFGIASTGDEVYVWLDGTHGGVAYLNTADDTMFTLTKGGKLVLPDSWKGPDTYSYRPQGWYDVKHGQYYPAGAEVTIEESTVFYPDWVPASYDIGQFDKGTANTISTNEFVTTKVFDYSTFFNIYNLNVDVEVSKNGHDENWSAKDAEKGFIFRNYSNTPNFACPEDGQSGVNGYTTNDANAGILTLVPGLIETLFGTDNSFNPETGEGVMGKTYLGTGDYLFQYCDDPANTEYYGYFYYDSLYHAASYNRTKQRFYVYNYLSRAETGSTADFLPLNHPQVNTNGRTPETYTNNGPYGQYVNTEHYQYTGGSGVASKYWFGIQADIKFFLPNKPGELDEDGNTVNRGVNGEELVFRFTGDDDVWVFVDGQLVLDIGGIHQAVEGYINFSTGEAVVDGRSVGNVRNLNPGEHVLTMYYLERGAGSSNCKVKFNISTRYGLKLQKEDVLTRHLLDGAEFTVYTEKSCAAGTEAELWTSHEAYEANEKARSTFVVENGSTFMWGLAAGNTYYIKETQHPPGGYTDANGIIVMKLDSKGAATFNVIEDPDAENGPSLSGGFTVHGYKIDMENHEAYLVATNGKYGDETTSVSVYKEWTDDIDHSEIPITAYLIANGKRIQEITLGENNDWKHTWTNLPMYDENKDPVEYSVQEGIVPGYRGTITTLEPYEKEVVTWKEVTSITPNEVYLLKTNNGYLSAVDRSFSKVDEETAKTSPNARWIITQSGGNYVFKNEAGITICYTNQRFYAYSRVVGENELGFSNGRIRVPNSSNYYMGTTLSGSGYYNRSRNSAQTFTLYMETTEKETVTFDGPGFLITNSPVEHIEETIDIVVRKEWDPRNQADAYDYIEYMVQVELFENGKDSGIGGTLIYQDDWKITFSGLLKYDDQSEPIEYTIEEINVPSGWNVEYGDLVQTGENTYELVIKNTYTATYRLPETGGGGRTISIIGGIMLIGAGSALIYKQIHQKRRKEEDSS